MRLRTLARLGRSGGNLLWLDSFFELIYFFHVYDSPSYIFSILLL